MLIILEGVDGAGKTTLANELVRRVRDADYVHRSQPQGDILTEYEDTLTYVPGGRSVVADRWHWGELVYGPVYRGGSALTPAQFTHVELFLRSRGVVVVLVDPGLDTVKERLATRGETFLQPGDVELVWRGFQAVAESSTCTWVKTAGTDPVDAERIISRAFDEQLRCHFLPRGYVGDPRPELLVLGDKRNSGPGLPFPPSPTNCGRHLLEALPTTSVGIANANEVDPYSLWLALDRPAVVVLGREAAKRCDATEIESFGTVPHPQYVRRFAHHHIDEYRAAIETAWREQRDVSAKELGWS